MSRVILFRTGLACQIVAWIACSVLPTLQILWRCWHTPVRLKATCGALGPPVARERLLADQDLRVDGATRAPSLSKAELQKWQWSKRNGHVGLLTVPKVKALTPVYLFSEGSKRIVGPILNDNIKEPWHTLQLQWHQSLLSSISLTMVEPCWCWILFAPCRHFKVQTPGTLVLSCHCSNTQILQLLLSSDLRRGQHCWFDVSQSSCAQGRTTSPSKSTNNRTEFEPFGTYLDSRWWLSI